MSDEPAWHARTAASLLAARQRSGRLGSKKSRAGCLTCKARKIKCDERHPECSRCRTTGRVCEWAGRTPPGATGESGSIVEHRRNNDNPTTNGHGSLFGMQLSQIFDLKKSDRRTFDYFLSWTAPRLGGTLDREFWSGYVLQHAQTEPLVLDALLAIATLYEHPQYMASFRPWIGTTSRRRIKAASDQADSEGSQPSINVTRALEEGEHGEFDKFETHPPVDRFHSAALLHYNRAMRRFRQRMEDGEATPTLALLSCVLFICIETIRDNVPSTMTLFSKGVEIIRQTSMARPGPQEQGLSQWLKDAFLRFSIVAATFGHTLPPQPPEVLPPTVPPPRFESMTEARISLYGLMTDIDVFIKKAHVWKTSLILPEGEDNDTEALSKALTEGRHRFVIPASLAGIMTDGTERPYRGFANTEEEIQRLEQIEKEQQSQRPDHADWDLQRGIDFSDLIKIEHESNYRLDQWFVALQGTLHNNVSNTNDSDNSPDNSKNQEDLLSASQLLMFYHTQHIWTNTRLSPYQTIFDTQTPHFEAILQHAEHYISAKAPEQSVFTFEVGAVPPLYFVATRCRVPSLRRRAVDLMRRAPRKEAIWGSLSTAEMASRIVEIEELGLGLPHPDVRGVGGEVSVERDGVLPAEERRVHSLELLQDRFTRAFDVRVTRFLPVEGGKLRRVVEEFHVFN